MSCFGFCCVFVVCCCCGTAERTEFDALAVHVGSVYALVPRFYLFCCFFVGNAAVYSRFGLSSALLLIFPYPHTPPTHTRSAHRFFPCLDCLAVFGSSSPRCIVAHPNAVIPTPCRLPSPTRSLSFTRYVSIETLSYLDEGLGAVCWLSVWRVEALSFTRSCVPSPRRSQAVWMAWSVFPLTLHSLCYPLAYPRSDLFPHLFCSAASTGLIFSTAPDDCLSSRHLTEVGAALPREPSP